MVQFINSELPHWLRKECRFVLAFLWASGLLCGVLVFHASGVSLCPLMRSIPFGAVTIVSLLCATMLPFLLSAFAVSICKPVWILFICFFKAFLFAFLSFGIVQAFGSAGWLFRYFLLFSDCAAMPFLYFYWLRCLSGARNSHGLEVLLIVSLAFLIGSVEYRIISPFLASLIEI